MRFLLFMLLAGSAIGQTLPMLNQFRFGQSITYLSETYVTNDSYAAFGTYTPGASQTVTNWTHTISNNSANARITVGVYVIAGESPFTNFISSETKVMAYPPSGAPVALTLTSVSNFWDSGDNNSFGIFSAPLGNVVATNWTIWVTNELQWSYFVGQSVVSRNANQTLAPDNFVWGADDGTALTSLSLTNATFTNDLAVAWAAHTATEAYGNPIGNFWNLSSGDSPQNSLVTTNEAEKFLNYASTNNLTLPGWTFASDWPSGTANMVGTVFRVPYETNGYASYISWVTNGALHSTSGGTSTPGLPTGLQTNDILVCLFATMALTNTVTEMHPDWTLITNHWTGHGIYMAAWWHRYNGVDPASRTVTNYTDRTTLSRISAYRGCTTTGSPIDSVGYRAAANSGTTITNLTTTVVASGALLVAVSASEGANTHSAPAGFSLDYTSSATFGIPDGSISSAYKAVAPGATGDVTHEQSDSDGWMGWMYSLKP